MDSPSQTSLDHRFTQINFNLGRETHPHFYDDRILQVSIGPAMQIVGSPYGGED